MKISTLQYKNYSAKIFNISKNEDISDMVGECNIALPTSSLISSLEAKFNIETKLIDEENEISIQVLDEVKNIIYSLQGKAKINKRTKSYTGNEIWEYSVKDSYEKLFEKVLTENKVYHNLFMCNENDKNNSLLHIIAENLGFKANEIDFVNLVYENGEFIRVPFVYLEENSRWIDILQTYIEASNGVLYVKNKKLFFRPRNFNINSALSLDRTNIITNIEEVRKEVLQNGIKVPYDRFELGENQTVFNIKNKIIVDENTNKDTEVPIMRINYITSAVNEPTLTKATAYYFTSDDPSTMTMIELVENTHYVIESWKETGCEVKFYNPLRYKLYIDNFEIKGRPLTKYEDNEINITFKTVEKNQENFITKSKNRLIQTKKQAIFLSKLAMKREISNSYEYNFNTKFLPNLEVGQVYNFTLDDINTVIEIESINISLKTSDFRMSVKAREIKNELEEIKVNAKLSGNSNSQYIDLSSIEKELAENKQELSSIKSSFESLEQSIQDSKTKIYTLKPAISTLTDSNIGDMYISDSSAEILVKENNSLVWKPITDSSVRVDLNEYIKSNDAKVIDIVYQNTEPENPKNGDIWIDTGNDGIWKRYINNTWVQIDESIRTAIATANTNIAEIENKIKTINNTIDNKILAKAFIQEEQPASGMKNHDIWYKSSDNTFKKWLNNRWNTATEDDIFPALRHYVSLATAQLDIGKRIDGVDEKAGMFLTNNNTKFGAKNGTLAEVSLSKTGEILIKNANNLIQWNVKDPTSNEMKSRFLMGVQNVDTVPAGTYFKVGDEATGFSLELKEGSSIAKINGQDLKDKLSNVDKNINNLSIGISDSLNTSKNYTDTKISEQEEKARLMALMSNGKMLYTDPEFKNGINGISSTPYNNNRANDDCITFTREVIAQTNTLRPPNSSGYALKISKRVGTASPGSGGFYWGHASRKEAVFITRIIANIPIGYNIDWHSNASGNNRVVKWLTNVAGTGKYEEYIHYHKCGSDTVVSNFSSTGFFAIHSQNGNNNVAVTWYLAYATVFDCTANRDDYISEVDRRLTNADGRLTQLQQNYQNTVQDVTNFKTQTADRIDTVQGALDNGNFVVNGNTTFADGVRFVSRGTNEVITIANGSIDFHRDGQKLTRIKNIRYGTCQTNSTGSKPTSIVNFEGFKQPMLLLTSIKSANFGKNMASVFCYAEHISGTQYKIFIGGTNEHYTEATPIKVVGKEWSASNVVVAKLHNITGFLDAISYRLVGDRRDNITSFFSNSYGAIWGFGKKFQNLGILKQPEFNLKIKINNEILHNENIRMNFYMNGPRQYAADNRVIIEWGVSKIILDKAFSLIKKYATRTNIKLLLEITITQPYLEVEKYVEFTYPSGSGDNRSYTKETFGIKGKIWMLTPAHFKGLSITASAETSTLSGVTGEGEVQYIAMEID